MKKLLIFAALSIIGAGLSGCKEKNPPEKTQSYLYNTFKEPCLQWGSSYVEVTSWMQTQGFRIKNEESYTEITYVHYLKQQKEDETMLVFYTNPSEYHCAYIYIDADLALEEIPGFMSERYNYLGVNRFRTKDNLTDIFIDYTEIDNKQYCIINYCKAE